MKRSHPVFLAQQQQPQEEAKKKKRYALNKTETSWVDCFPLSAELRPTAQQFDALWNLHPEAKGEVKIFGKMVATPRWQQSYGLPYTFSGVMHAALPVPDAVQPFLDWANAQTEYLAPYGGQRFNMALLNWYQDGNHYIGYHSDDERQLVQSPTGDSVVFSVSLGQKRTLSLRPIEKGETLQVKMANCSVLVMGGRCQKTHKHAVPKVAGAKGQKLGRRINLTFRIFVTP